MVQTRQQQRHRLPFRASPRHEQFRCRNFACRINAWSWQRGEIVIDMSGNGHAMPANSCSPVCSPRSCGDFGYGLWPYYLYRGFLMSSTVEEEGKCSKLMVEVGVQHVSCMEDAAVLARRVYWFSYASLPVIF